MRKMPRTKQTKPRHIVENDKASEGVSSPLSPLQGFRLSPKNAEEHEEEEEEEEEAFSAALNCIDVSDSRGTDCNPSRTEVNLNDFKQEVSRQGEKIFTSNVSLENHCKRSNQTSSNIDSKYPESVLNKNVVELGGTGCLPGNFASFERSNKSNADINNWKDLFESKSSNYLVNQSSMNKPSPKSSDHQLDLESDKCSPSPVSESKQNLWEEIQLNTIQNDVIASKGYTQEEDVENNALNGDRCVKKSHQQHHGFFPNDPLQYQFYNAMTSQYFNTIKEMIQTNGSAANISDNSKFWKMWADAARAGFRSPPENLENSHLYHRYFAQLAERWNSYMAGQLSTSEVVGRYHPYYNNLEGPDESRKLNQTKVVTNTSWYNSKDKLHDNENHKSSNLNQHDDLSSTEHSIESSPLPAQTSTKAMITIDELKESDDSLTQSHEDTQNLDKTIEMPLEKDTQSKFTSEASSPSLSYQGYSPNTITEQDNLRISDKFSTLSSSSNHQFTHVENPPTLFTSNPSIPSSAWLSYNSPKLSNTCDRPSLSHLSTQKGIPYTFMPIPYQGMGSFSSTIPSHYDKARKRSLCGEKVSNLDLPMRIPGSTSVSPPQGLSPLHMPPHRKFSAPAPCVSSRIADIRQDHILKEMRRHYSVSHPPFGPHWLGAGLPPNHITSPTFAGFHSPLNSKNGNHQLFFPPRVPLLSNFPIRNSLSPQPAAGYNLGLPYKATTSSSLQSPNEKMNETRRSRTRTAPIDSVHAAIVREAKEQFKGLDPENMYIQCPICQKRIKRLYHFQRHMRIHTGEKTHQCSFCQYKSVRKDNLKSHIKTHEKHTLENNRKTGKIGNSGSKKLEVLHGNSFNQSINPNHSNVPLISISHPEVPHGHGAFNNEKVTSPKRKYSQTLKSDLWRELNNNNSQHFALPFSSAYAMSHLPPALNPGVDNCFIPKGENCNLLKSSVIPMKIDTLTSQSVEHHKIAHNFESENGHHDSSSHISSLDISADVESAADRQVSENISNSEKAQVNLVKKYRESADDMRDLILYQNHEGASKKPKLMINGSETEESNFSLPRATTNTSNNNSNTIAEDNMSKEKTISSPSSTLETEKRNLGSKRHSVSQFPVLSRSIHSISDETKTCLYNEKILSHFPAGSRKFDSGASVALAELAAAAAAANKECHDPTISKDTMQFHSFENSSLTTNAGSSSSVVAASSSFSVTTKPLKNDVLQTTSCDLKVSPPCSQAELSAFPPKNYLKDDVMLRNDVDMVKNDKESMTYVKSHATIKAEAPSSRCHLYLHTEKYSAENNNGEHIEADESAIVKNQSAPGLTSNDKKAGDGSSVVKALVCRLCSFQPTSTNELQSHMVSMHKQDGFYKCDECNYLGKNLSKLVEHIRIHTGERPFKCDQCTYAAKRKDNLAQHKAVKHDKRKAKTNSLYSVLADKFTRDSTTKAAVEKGPTGINALFHNAKKNLSESAIPITSDRLPLFPNLRFVPNIDINSDFAFGCDFNKRTGVSTATTPPQSFPAFSAMQNFSPSMFRYPIYPTHPLVYPGDLPANLTENAVKTVVDKLNNSGTYSVKVRAALI